MDELLDYNKRDRLYNFLIDDFGLLKLSENYDEENFGNFSILLSSINFLVNYVNDRSFLTIEIASKYNPDKWYDLSFIKDFMDVAQEENQKKINLSNKERIKVLNNFLAINFNNISELMNEKNYIGTQIQLDQFLKEQFKGKFK